MKTNTVEQLKVGIGMLLGLSIGAACRFLEIPAPAPPVFAGALLVVAMTVGYASADRWLVLRQARNKAFCGGPDGSTKSSTDRTA